MSFIRVAAFDMPGSYEVWDATLGAYLRSNPDCIAAVASSDGSRWLVVTEWTNAGAYEAGLTSPELRTAYEEAAAGLGFTPDLEPSFLFEGEVGVRF
jgi:quinol monooxygenase YgiN